MKKNSVFNLRKKLVGFLLIISFFSFSLIKSQTNSPEKDFSNILTKYGLSIENVKNLELEGHKYIDMKNLWRDFVILLDNNMYSDYHNNELIKTGLLVIPYSLSDYIDIEYNNDPTKNKNEQDILEQNVNRLKIIRDLLYISENQDDAYTINHSTYDNYDYFLSQYPHPKMQERILNSKNLYIPRKTLSENVVKILPKFKINPVEKSDIELSNKYISEFIEFNKQTKLLFNEEQLKSIANNFKNYQKIRLVSDKIKKNPNKASFYADRASLYCSLNFEDFEKKCYDDFSKAISLEPKNNNYRWGRVNVYEIGSDEFYNSSQILLKDLNFLVNSSNNTQNQSEYYSKIGKFNEYLYMKNNSIEIATSGINAFKKAHLLKETDYDNAISAANFYKKIGKTKDGCDYLESCIVTEKNIHTKLKLIEEKGNLFRSNNDNQSAIQEFDKIFSYLDNEFQKNQSSLSLISERIYFTCSVANKKYYNDAIQILEKLINYYNTNSDCGDGESYGYFTIFSNNYFENVSDIKNSKNSKCIEKHKSDIDDLIKLLDVISIYNSYFKKDTDEFFLKYYRRVKNLK